MGQEKSAGDWSDYQEEAAEFFRSLGFQAQTNVTLQGVRTEHDIDVAVEIELVGFSVRWIIECKHWKTPVNKLHVLALRQIVSDLGADRGIILCEVGFQSGAVEAANLTNVQVTSLNDLTVQSQASVAAFKLRELFDRATVCLERYWEIPKDRRIEVGLRSDFTDGRLYNGAFVVEAVEKILGLAFRGAYPISVDPLQQARLAADIPPALNDPAEVLAVLEPVVARLEAKLDGVNP